MWGNEGSRVYAFKEHLVENVRKRLSAARRPTEGSDRGIEMSKCFAHAQGLVVKGIVKKLNGRQFCLIKFGPVFHIAVRIYALCKNKIVIA